MCGRSKLGEDRRAWGRYDCDCPGQSAQSSELEEIRREMLDDRARGDAERGSLECPPPDLRYLDDAEGVKDGEKGYEMKEEMPPPPPPPDRLDSLLRCSPSTPLLRKRRSESLVML